jgi:hypothetical protein
LQIPPEIEHSFVKEQCSAMPGSSSVRPLEPQILSAVESVGGAALHPAARLDRPYRRGDEKSVFKFGGSPVIVFGEPGKWRPAADILQNTQENIETPVQLGSAVALTAVW